MRTLTYFIGMSLDGFIAAPDGDPSHLTVHDDVVEMMATELPDTIPTAARGMLGVGDGHGRFDTVVMGRATYEPALAAGIRSPYAHLRQVIVSSTLPPSDDPGVEIRAGDAVEIVRELKQQDGGDIWLAGGGRLAGALLHEIDELVVKLYPFVQGDGIRVVDGDFGVERLELVEARVMASGTVLLRHRAAQTPHR